MNVLGVLSTASSHCVCSFSGVSSFSSSVEVGRHTRGRSGGESMGGGRNGGVKVGRVRVRGRGSLTLIGGLLGEYSETPVTLCVEAKHKFKL